MHLDAYVDNLVPLSILYVSIAFISPIVPMDIKSSKINYKRNNSITKVKLGNEFINRESLELHLLNRKGYIYDI